MNRTHKKYTIEIDFAKHYKKYRHVEYKVLVGLVRRFMGEKILPKQITLTQEK
jgi:hypothetical protein